MNGIVETYLHVGVDVKAGPLSLLWSRLGMQSLIKSSGDLYSSLSLVDAVCFTCLAADVRKVVDGKLAAVFHQESALIYLQLYNNNPCLRPQEFHPVSCLFMACGAIHPQVTNVLLD